MNNMMDVHRRQAGRSARRTLLILPAVAAALALTALPDPGQSQEIVIRPQAQGGWVACRGGPSTDPGTAPGWLGMELVQTWPPQPGVLRESARQGEGRAGGGPGTLTDLEIRVSAVAEGGPAELAGIRRGDRLLSVDGERVSPSLLDRLVLGVTPGSEAVVGVERDGEELEFVVEAKERPCLWPGIAIHLDSLQVRGLERLQIGVDTSRTAFRMDTLWAARAREIAEARAARAQEGADLAAEMGERLRAIRIEGGTPLVLGQRMVAGAELSPLNLDLARYFGTSEGLLVLSVTGASPAERAGLLAGDVIVAIGGEGVRDLAGARTAFSRAFASPPVAVDVIREGERVSLEFDR